MSADAAPELAPHAAAFCRVALANIEREYPNKPDHVLNGVADLLPPSALHPVFYGSYDWHSSVHMHWLLARLLRLVPALAEAPRVHALFDRHFTPARVTAELAYLEQPSRRSFERTYGWAWLLKLQAELIMLSVSDPQACRWRETLQPLAQAFVERFLAFLPLATYPIRAGTHANSAFGLLFALDYAQRVQHLALRKAIIDKAHAWYGRDRRYPAAYEPGGEDFLSGGLLEALLMRQATDACSYADWWELFCPSRPDLQAWLTPAQASDRSDPRLAHLDGLNLSRVWCWKRLADGLPQELQPLARQAADVHLASALPHAVTGDYAGTHWLASFALLALTE